MPTASNFPIVIGAGRGTIARPPMTTATSRPPWLWNPTADLLIGCGAWTLPLLALSGGLAQAAGPQLAFAFALLTVVCNHPHYMATIQRAAASRERRAAYRPYLVHLTALFGLALLALFSEPALIPAVFTLYVVWSPWHYSAQNFGLTMLFARRAEAAPTAGERRLLRGAFIASYVVWLLTVQSQPSADPYVWSLDLPARVADPLAALLTVGFLLAGSAALGGIGRRAGGRAIIAPAVLLSTQTLWFIAPWVVQAASGRGVSPVYYTTGALAFMHCAQYLWVTSFAERRTRGAGAWRPARYAAGLVLGGIALFTAGPWLASAVTAVDLRESTLIFIALVNLHHFVLDGALWRLRERRVVEELVGTAPTPTTAPVPALRPALGWALAAVLLGLAALNGVQHYLTLEGGDARGLELARRLNPHDTRVDVRRAQLLAESGRADAALAILEPLLGLEAANAASLRLYGNLLVTSGRHDQALAHLQAVRASVGLDAPGLVNAGVLLAQRGSLDEAAAALRDALRLDPRLSAAHLNLAGVCLQGGDGRCALRHYLAYLDAPGVPRDRDYAAALLNAAGAAELAEQPAAASVLRRDGTALARELASN